MIRRRAGFSGCAAAVLMCLFAWGPGHAAADTIRISGTGAALETIRVLSEAFRKAHPDTRFVLLPSIGSTGAIKAVLAGRLDIGLCARPLTDEERAQGAIETRYARTPLVFGVHPAVREPDVTIAYVVEIYEGKRTRWRNGTRIRPVLRPPTDSDVPVLKRISPEMEAAVESALRREGMTVAATDQDVADMIEHVPGAFGAVTLALVLSEKKAIRVLPVNGVEPNLATLRDGSYPHSKIFCMVTRRDLPEEVRRFIDFVQSAKGAAILEKNGQAAVH